MSAFAAYYMSPALADYLGNRQESGKSLSELDPSSDSYGDQMANYFGRELAWQVQRGRLTSEDAIYDWIVKNMCGKHDCKQHLRH
ncbi:MAG: hypothetical protein HRF45_09600 [Fimbriimonadia bacterium]|jgi:hypothetical protein